MINPLETIAYAVARGAVRAYLDVLRESELAIEEVAKPADASRASRFRDAVQRVRDQDDSDTRPEYPPSDSGTNSASNLGR